MAPWTPCRQPQLVAPADEHGVLMENLPARRPFVLSALCGKARPPSPRPDAQSSRLDAPRDGQTGEHGPSPRFPPPTCSRNAPHSITLLHRKNGWERTEILDVDTITQRIDIFYLHHKLIWILKRRINANLHEFYQLSRWIELDKNNYMVNSWAITW